MSLDNMTDDLNQVVSSGPTEAAPKEAQPRRGSGQALKKAQLRLQDELDREQPSAVAQRRISAAMLLLRTTEADIERRQAGLQQKLEQAGARVKDLEARITALQADHEQLVNRYQPYNALTGGWLEFYDPQLSADGKYRLVENRPAPEPPTLRQSQALATIPVRQTKTEAAVPKPATEVTSRHDVRIRGPHPAVIEPPYQGEPMDPWDAGNRNGLQIARWKESGRRFPFARPEDVIAEW